MLTSNCCRRSQSTIFPVFLLHAQSFVINSLDKQMCIVSTIELYSQLRGLALKTGKLHILACKFSIHHRDAQQDSVV